MTNSCRWPHFNLIQLPCRPARWSDVRPCRRRAGGFHPPRHGRKSSRSGQTVALEFSRAFLSKGGQTGSGGADPALPQGQSAGFRAAVGFVSGFGWHAACVRRFGICRFGLSLCPVVLAVRSRRSTLRFGFFGSCGRHDMVLVRFARFARFAHHPNAGLPGTFRIDRPYQRKPAAWQA